jgi:hypothetical protein
MIPSVYFIHRGKWHVMPDQEIYIDAVMKSHIEFDSGHDILEGALVYRIQRRQHTKSDKLIQEESKRIQLLVAWRVEHTEGLDVRALLVEHDKGLDEDKLRRLHQKYWRLLKARINPIRSSWMLDDATVLTTTIDAMNGGHRWDIFIFEEEEDSIERPLWINATK